MPLDVDDVMQATKFQVHVPTRLGDGIFILLSSCEFQLSEFEWDFCASMASKQTKPWNTTEETVELALDSDFVVDSTSEFGNLSSSERRNARCGL